MGCTAAGVLLGSMWSFLWLSPVRPAHRPSGSSRRRRMRVLSMAEVRAALNDYAAAQGGAFPQTLEPLGLTRPAGRCNPAK